MLQKLFVVLLMKAETEATLVIKSARRRERLRPAWTTRWILDPARIAPGTAMPSGLFRREGDRWVFAGPLPPAVRGYVKDHADLLVRYMFQLTPEEQRLLVGRSRAAGSSGPAGNP